MYAIVLALQIWSGGHWHNFEVAGHARYRYGNECTSALSSELARVVPRNKRHARVVEARCEIQMVNEA
jgi:hypothetical protein